ncbi:MAG: FCD domain-containing protein [Pseudomonadota bacterium]
MEQLVAEDRELVDDPAALARTNRRFHRQVHLASHNRYLVQQLDLVYRSMALMATTSLAAEGRPQVALDEHAAIVEAIKRGDGDAAYVELKGHISRAFEARLKQDANDAAGSFA